MKHCYQAPVFWNAHSHRWVHNSLTIIFKTRSIGLFFIIRSHNLRNIYCQEGQRLLQTASVSLPPIAPFNIFDLHCLPPRCGSVLCYRARGREGQNIKGQAADVHTRSSSAAPHLQQLCFRVIPHPLRAWLQRLCSWDADSMMYLWFYDSDVSRLFSGEPIVLIIFSGL